MYVDWFVFQIKKNTLTTQTRLRYFNTDVLEQINDILSNTSRFIGFMRHETPDGFRSS